MVQNDVDAHRTLLGLAWLRAVEVPLNAAFTGRILAYSLDHADVTTLVVAPAFLERVADVIDEVPSVHTMVVLGALDAATRRPCSPECTVVDRDELVAAPPLEPAPAGPEYHDVHSLMFTSGTTGPSKAVITPWPVMYQFWSWVPDDTLAPGDGLYLRDADVPQLGPLGVQLRDGARRALRAARALQRDRVLERRARHRGDAPPRSSDR